MPNTANSQKQAQQENEKKGRSNLIDESLKIATPAWPLQNTVAVNPFWFLRDKGFDAALGEASVAVQTLLMMPISFYREKIQRGEITTTSIQEALQSARQRWPELPSDVEPFLKISTQLEAEVPKVKTFAEFFGPGESWAPKISAELGKYAAAYFDDKQACVPFPVKDESFWTAWIKMQSFDKTMDVWGAKGFQDSAEKLDRLDAVQAIEFMLQDMDLSSSSQQLYLTRLNASVMGWSTQFKYLEWQRSLGYSVSRSSSAMDLLAVRLAYDYILYALARKRFPGPANQWLRKLESSAQKSHSSAPSSASQAQSVFQLAWELSYQKSVIRQMRDTRAIPNGNPRVQMVFCIDVRSEMIRRHLERTDPGIQTIGFAGFFGLAFDFHRVGESQTGHRLPVLLKPAFQVEEASPKPEAAGASFLRSLRKNSLSSFTYVELLGATYVEKMFQELWSSLNGQIRGDQVPNRFASQKGSLDHRRLMSSAGQILSTADLVPRVAGVLRHMGLTSGFAEQVWIVGHGSATKNNAFGSSLDCGACGGHAGDVNARLLVSLLNDAAIRQGLRDQKIEIPAKTLFIAAVHETVTDEIYPLEVSELPRAAQYAVGEVRELLGIASGTTRQERQKARSGVLDPNSKVRSQNWSEVRPEWGLAGNACFIVAPRVRTSQINLSSRSFLHDYDWRKDAESGYQTLELIMTAPMVVTNWINLQYYASTVAPNVYGAGNKILHNLTNECGVVEGNGGDLRVGLPIQSVHDGERFVHDPLRLTVFIEAPQEEIEKIIRKHQVVRELIENEWLHLVQIDSQSLNISRRLPTGEYVIQH